MLSLEKYLQQALYISIMPEQHCPLNTTFTSSLPTLPPTFMPTLTPSLHPRRQPLIV
jgi:hypothetical protein